MKINVLNIGPVEWFSPHFVYTDDTINAMFYDPLKTPKNLRECIEKNKIDSLNVFRHDLVAEELSTINYTPYIEWSTEIYPRLLDSENFANNCIGKYYHCLSKTDRRKRFIHYDSSRSKFLDFCEHNYINHFLPVNTSYLKPSCVRDIDVLFFGRASPKRSLYLGRLKELGIKFVWIENGLSFGELSSYLNRTKVVVNISAEYLDNFEPRINIGLAYGAMVVTEVSHGLVNFMSENMSYSTERIYTFGNHIDDFIGTIFYAISSYEFDDSWSRILSANLSYLDCLRQVYKI